MALDPAFGLRRARRNNANPQLGAHAAELRQRLGAGGALLLIRRPHIHVFPIGIERVRNPVLRDPRAPHAHGRPARFLRAKGPQTPAGRVIDHRQQTTRRAAAFKPGMKTAIELHQLAEVGHPLATTPMRTAPPRAAPEARRQHPAPPRVVVHVHAVFARQVLRRQRRPESLVHRTAVLLPDQGEDLLPFGRLPRRTRANTPARVSSRVLIAVRPNPRPPVAA